MEKQADTNTSIALETIITNAIQIPGVRVNRNEFLAKTFASKTENIVQILEEGPVSAGISRDQISHLAAKLILARTSKSTLISFATGLPGGIAMAAAIPADIMQFFATSFVLAQELAYLYGEPNLWENGLPDDERIQKQFMIYCGVMFGVSGAEEGLRLLSVQLAKTALKQLPKQALTKAFWFPLVKQIGKVVGIRITKSTVAKGVSKAIPIVGGVVSGSINFASMMPMAKRLQAALDSAHFDYTEEEILADIRTLEHLSTEQPDDVLVADAEPAKKSGLKDKFSAGMKNVGGGVSSLFAKKTKAAPKDEPVSAEETPSAPSSNTDDVFAAIKKLAELKEMGAITQEEFNLKKTELLARL